MTNRKIFQGSSDCSKSFDKQAVVAIESEDFLEVLDVLRNWPGLNRLNFIWIGMYTLLGDDMTKLDHPTLDEFAL